MNFTEHQILRNLQVARDYIAEFGWKQGELGAPGEPVCGEAALRIAVCNSTLPSTQNQVEELSLTRYYFVLYGIGQGLGDSSYLSHIWKWNDRKRSVRKRVWWRLFAKTNVQVPQTKANVLATFDTAIREIKSRIALRDARNADPHEFDLPK